MFFPFLHSTVNVTFANLFFSPPDKRFEILQLIEQTTEPYNPVLARPFSLPKIP